VRARGMFSAFALWLVCAATPASAQVFRARLVDASAGSPVSGAFVLLIDSTGAKAIGALSDSAGRADLRAPRAGTYTARIERLGYETHNTAPYVLTAGAVVSEEVRVPGRAIVLEGIEAAGQNRCRGRTDMTGATVAIWGEIRKTLAVAAWTSEKTRYSYDYDEVQRELNGSDRRIRGEEKSKGRLTNAQSPFASLAADVLFTKGFVQQDLSSGSWMFYGPDADVLQSDEFLGAHCFRPVTDPKQPRLVGLAFEPTTRGSNTGINGTLWIDRVTYGLDHLDFWFGWLPFDVPEDRFVGGRIDFAKLADGGWIVPSWTLRVPSFGRDVRRRTFIAAYLERSRSITAAYRSDGTPMPLPPRR
jgi:hypothetical protein